MDLKNIPDVPITNSNTAHCIFEKGRQQGIMEEREKNKQPKYKFNRLIDYTFYPYNYEPVQLTNRYYTYGMTTL